jgi:hypothetical protein
MMAAIRSSETPALTSATRRHIPEDDILQTVNILETRVISEISFVNVSLYSAVGYSFFPSLIVHVDKGCEV